MNSVSKTGVNKKKSSLCCITRDDSFNEKDNRLLNETKDYSDKQDDHILEELRTLKREEIELLKRQQEEQKRLHKKYDDIMQYLLQKEQNNPGSPGTKRTEDDKTKLFAKDQTLTKDFTESNEDDSILTLRNTLSRLDCSFDTPPSSSTQSPQPLLKLQRFRNMQQKGVSTNSDYPNIVPHLFGYHQSNTAKSNFLNSTSIFDDKSLAQENLTSTSYDVLDLKNQLLSNCNEIRSAISDVNKELYTVREECSENLSKQSENKQ